MFIDGHTIRVRVSDPPPAVFTVSQSPDLTRVLVLRRYSPNGAIYVERDRRKATVPVETDRRRRRRENCRDSVG
jgi:hypothetical protein